MQIALGFCRQIDNQSASQSLSYTLVQAGASLSVIPHPLFWMPKISKKNIHSFLLSWHFFLSELTKFSVKSCLCGKSMQTTTLYSRPLRLHFFVVFGSLGIFNEIWRPLVIYAITLILIRANKRSTSCEKRVKKIASLTQYLTSCMHDWFLPGILAAQRLSHADFVPDSCTYKNTWPASDWVS